MSDGGERSEALPPGWAWATVGEVCDIRDSLRQPVNSEERSNRVGDFPYYGANGQAGTIDDFLFEGPHILLAEDGGFFDVPGKTVAYRVDGRFWVNNHAHVLRSLSCALDGIVLHQLNTMTWAPHVSGSTRLKLTQAAMLTIQLQIPPLAEQRRIVAKLDDLIGRSRSAREALDEVPAMLERYRQSVLAAAFRGDLTAEWREQHPEVEPATELLGRIRDQRRANAPALSKHKWVPDLEQGHWSMEAPPPKWAWCLLQDVVMDRTTSDSKLPQSAYSAEGKLPVIDQGATVPGGYSDQTELAYPGTLPVIVFGDHTRRAHFIDYPFIQGADGTKVLSPVPLNCARYLWWMIRAIKLPDKGYSRHFKFLRASRFPLPPLEEQHEIVRRIEAAFAKIDAVAKTVDEQRAALDAYDRALLTKAFRGELVEQDPADEPASVMLERVRAERAVNEESAPKRRGRAKRTG